MPENDESVHFYRERSLTVLEKTHILKAKVLIVGIQITIVIMDGGFEATV